MGKGVKAGEAFVNILANTTKFEKGLRRAQATLKNFGSNVQKIGLSVAASGIAMTAPFIVAAKVFAKIGDDLEKMSRRTGVAVESLSALGFAAEQSGSSLAVLEKGIKTMQRSVVDLSRDLSTQKDAFGAIGLTFKDIRDLKPEDQFKLIADRISKIDDPTKRAATSLMIFGRAGAELLPLMEDGAAGIEKLQKQAEDLGIVVSEEQAKAAAEFTDEMNILFRVIQKGIFEIGQSVRPAISSMINKIVEIAKETMEWIRNNRALIATAFKVAVTVAAVGSAIAIVGALIIGASAILGIFAGAIAAVITIISSLVAGLAALLSPIGLMIAAISIAAVLIVKRFGLIEKAVNALKNLFTRLKDTFGSAIETIVKAIKSGNIEGAFNVLMASVDVIIKKGVVKLLEAWNGFKSGVVDVAASTFIGLLSQTDNVVSSMRKLFNKLTDDIAKAFITIKNKTKSAYDQLTSEVAKVLLKLKNTGEDVVAAVAGRLAQAITTDVRVVNEIGKQTTEGIISRREDQAAIIKSIDAETAKNKKDLEAETASQSSRLDAATEKDNAAIDEQKRLRQKLVESVVSSIKSGIEEDVKTDIEDANKDLIKSQENLAKVIDETNKTTQDASEDSDDFQSVFDDLQKAIDGFSTDQFGATDPLKVAAKGGFNPFGLGRQNQAFQDQMLKATKDNEKNTKKLAKNQGNGAVFQ